MTSRSVQIEESGHSRKRRAAAVAIALTLALSGILVVEDTAWAAETSVPMGTLTDFSVLAHTTITDTGSTSTFTDGVGVSPGTDITTIGPAQVASGGIHRNDATAVQAQTDLSAAYLYAANQPANPIPLAAALGGQTLPPGVHSAGATALGLTGTLTLDGEGDKGSVFIIRTSGAFTAAAASIVLLTNGAQECNVFWQIGGAVTLGADATFRGSILATGAVTVGLAAHVYGRAFTRLGDMTLSANTFHEPTCGGVTVSPSAVPLVTTEAGGTATFTVVLNTQPTATVTIGVSSDDPSEGSVSSALLSFTTLDWNLAQTVTVTGVNDAVDDGNVAYTLLLAPAVGGDYTGTNPTDVTATNTDNDPVGVTVTPSAVPLVTTEAGGTATFTVVLDSQPSATVTIGVSSGDITEGTVSTASLSFTNLNWNLAHTVTVTGVNDAVDDGNVAYTVLLAAAVGGDYAGIDPADVAASNTDNDIVGVTVVPSATPLITTEAGGTATFTVVLNTEPTAPVSIGVSSSDTTEGTVSTATLSFTNLNWNLAQTVTVTGVNDLAVDGNIAYTVLLASAVGGEYAGIDPADVAASNTDNDIVGVTVTPSAIPLVTTEAGGSATFTVVLNTQPTATVTIGVSSDDPSEGSVSSALLSFTTLDWNLAQTVTVTGVNDAVDDGNVAYTLLLAPAVGGDYTGTNPTDVTATNTDNDPVGVTVTPSAVPLVTTEAGGTATFTVVLDSQPSATVTIGVSSGDITEGTVSTASLSFTNLNWNLAHTVTVTGVNDAVDDGNVAYTVLLAAAVGGDYAGTNPTDVTATNTDNDDPVVVVVVVGGGGAVPPPTVTPGLVDTSAACPESIALSRFGDVVGFDVITVQAIDCIVHYGISNGTSDLTFNPSGTVSRWQMALFLIRQVQVHGVALPAATDHGFVDIAGYNLATRDAINQLAQLGITRGAGMGIFSPSDSISRWEMALFLIRFASVVGIPQSEVGSALFPDMGSFDEETRSAVDQLVQYGIAAGTSSSTFEPAGRVLRWQMALFLTRMLARDGVVPS